MLILDTTNEALLPRARFTVRFVSYHSIWQAYAYRWRLDLSNASRRIVGYNILLTDMCCIHQYSISMQQRLWSTADDLMVGLGAQNSTSGNFYYSSKWRLNAQVDKWRLHNSSKRRLMHKLTKWRLIHTDRRSVELRISRHFPKSTRYGCSQKCRLRRVLL